MKNSVDRPLVTLMVALQAVTVAILWLLDAFSVGATAAFALFLAGNATAFAIVAHVYRTAASDSRSPANQGRPQDLETSF